MNGARFLVRQVRIDIPLQSVHAYFFVEREMERWGPWWTTLYDFLLKFVPSDDRWRYSLDQDVYVGRPELEDAQKVAIVAFLRTAPAHQISQHRTLRRAVELPDERVRDVELVYFSAGEGPALDGH